MRGILSDNSNFLLLMQNKLFFSHLLLRLFSPIFHCIILNACYIMLSIILNLTPMSCSLLCRIKAICAEKCLKCVYEILFFKICLWICSIIEKQYMIIDDERQEMRIWSRFKLYSIKKYILKIKLKTLW